MFIDSMDGRRACSNCGEMTSILEPCSCAKERMGYWKNPYNYDENPMDQIKPYNKEHIESTLKRIEELRKKAYEEQEAQKKADKERLQKAIDDIGRLTRKQNTTYDRIVVEQADKEYNEKHNTVKEDCPGRSSAWCDKCKKCHSVFASCIPGNTDPLTMYNKPGVITTTGTTGPFTFTPVEGEPGMVTVEGAHDDKTEISGWSDYDTVPTEEDPFETVFTLENLYDELGKYEWTKMDVATVTAVRELILGRLSDS